jgi:hypothetical protein
MDLNVIQSYLVGLGYTVDQPSLNKFKQALKDADLEVETSTGKGVKRFAALATAAVTAYQVVAAGTVGLMDRVAQGELGFQLYAMKMYMSVDAAKKLKISLES